MVLKGDNHLHSLNTEVTAFGRGNFKKKKKPKNLYNKEQTSDATATRFCVLQNKHVMEANRPQSVMSTQSHHSPSFREYSWLTGQMIEHVRVTPGHCSLCNIFNVQTLIFVLWESGILRFHSVWQNDVRPRFSPTGVQHSSSSLPSFQFVTCFQDLVVKVLRLVGIHIVTGSTDCLQEGKRIRREAAN